MRELPRRRADVVALEPMRELLEGLEAARAGGGETILRLAPKRRFGAVESPIPRRRSRVDREDDGERREGQLIHHALRRARASATSTRTLAWLRSRTTPRDRRETRQRRSSRSSRGRACRPRRPEGRGRPSGTLWLEWLALGIALDPVRNEMPAKPTGATVQSSIDLALKLSGNVAPAATEKASGKPSPGCCAARGACTRGGRRCRRRPRATDGRRARSRRATAQTAAMHAGAEKVMRSARAGHPAVRDQGNGSTERRRTRRVWLALEGLRIVGPRRGEETADRERSEGAQRRERRRDVTDDEVERGVMRRRFEQRARPDHGVVVRLVGADRPERGT